MGMKMLYTLVGSTSNYHKYDSKDTVGILYIPRVAFDPAPKQIEVTVTAKA